MKDKDGERHESEAAGCLYALSVSAHNTVEALHSLSLPLRLRPPDASQPAANPRLNPLCRILLAT
jgi:hypothetical protein